MKESGLLLGKGSQWDTGVLEGTHPLNSREMKGGEQIINRCPDSELLNEFVWTILKILSSLQEFVTGSYTEKYIPDSLS